MLICVTFFLFAVIIDVPENELRDFIEGDLRETIVSRNRKRKMETTGDELAATKEALNKVTKEMDELRSELSKIRGETTANLGFAFGFSPGEFNSMNYTKGLAWIETELAVKVKAEAAKFPKHFEMSKMMGEMKHTGIRVCARFNRGEGCQFPWHVHNKPNKKGQGQHRELRLHCCAVCAEAFGIWAGHQLMDCPWIKTETWSALENEDNFQV